MERLDDFILLLVEEVDQVVDLAALERFTDLLFDRRVIILERLVGDEALLRDVEPLGGYRRRIIALRHDGFFIDLFGRRIFLHHIDWHILGEDMPVKEHVRMYGV